MAGLLAGRMLSHKHPMIFEAQPALPNNHSAVLRFRSSIVGDTLNIPFRKVSMIKTTERWMNPVADALSYSKKNTGKYLSNRSINSYELINVDRYIAPPDLISRMANDLNIVFNSKMDKLRLKAKANAIPIISTVPMPALMEMLDYPHLDSVEFKYRTTCNIRATIPNCDAYVTIMVPSPHLPFSRISITGDELIVETTLEHEDYVKAILAGVLTEVANIIGIKEIGYPSVHVQKYAKIISIDEDLRRHFLSWASVTRNVYSLGRFATWRHFLLMDDLVKDVRLIEKWAFSSNKYDLKRAS